MQNPCTSIYKKAELDCLYKSSSVSQRIVLRWINKFKIDLKYVPQAGCLKTVLTGKNIEAVVQLLNENGRHTLCDISQTLHINCDRVHTIITKNLKRRKICTKWIPHLLTEEQKKPTLLNVPKSY